jgi:hypothetical protein
VISEIRIFFFLEIFGIEARLISKSGRLEVGVPGLDMSEPGHCQNFIHGIDPWPPQV